MVLPLAIVDSRLSISRRHGTNSRGRLRLQNKPCLGGQIPLTEFRFSTKFDRESLFLLLFLNFIFRNNFENAYLVVHFFTNQMQISFDSKKKIGNSIWQVPR